MNAVTLASYAAHIDEYMTRTPRCISEWVTSWLGRAIDGLSLESSILEIGSGPGRDAQYLRELGFNVECSDACAEWISHLTSIGLPARRLNVLTDDVGEKCYDLILANAVLLHFGEGDFVVALTAIKRALKPGGSFAFTVKRGAGSAWETEKLGAPRFFMYWEEDSLLDILREAGLSLRTDVLVSESWLGLVVEPTRDTDN